jgi:hypothetical protein
MSKQVVFVVLGILIVSLIGVCLFQRQQLQRLSEEHAALSQKLEQSAQAKNKRTVANTETKKALSCRKTMWPRPPRS